MKTLKKFLCSEPVLKVFHPSLETEVHTDASKDGLGACMLQKDPEDGQFHPIFFVSFKTTSAEEKLSSYELEVLAIVRALGKLRVYLLGLTFKIYTDCKAFELTMNKRELSSKIARWALFLSEFDCTVIHRAGSAMKHVDALSRYPVVKKIESSVLEKLRKSQHEDERIKLIMEMLKISLY